MLFDFGGAGRASSRCNEVKMAFAEEDLCLEEQESARPSSFKTSAGELTPTAGHRDDKIGSSAKRRKRVFDFGDDDDDDDVYLDCGNAGDFASGYTGESAHQIQTRQSMLPIQQQRDPSSHNAEQTSISHDQLGGARAQASASQATRVSTNLQAIAPASIIDKIFRDAKAESSMGTERLAAGKQNHAVNYAPLDAVNRIGRYSESEARDWMAQTQNSNPQTLTQNSSSQHTQPSKGFAPNNCVDRMWKSSYPPSQHKRGVHEFEAGPSQGTQCRMGFDRSQHDSREARGLPHAKDLYTETRSFSQAARPRDVWKELEMQGGMNTQSSSQRKLADEYAREVLLSPPKSAARTAPKQRRESRDDEDELGIHPVHALSGWATESARTKGGRGSSMGGAFDSDGVLVDHSFCDDGPRILPGPAGKLSNLQVVAGRSKTSASPLLQEQPGDEQTASREMREGISSDATGPQLPLRKTFLVNLKRHVLQLLSVFAVSKSGMAPPALLVRWLYFPSMMTENVLFVV
jgi:hypothetical protein